MGGDGADLYERREFVAVDKYLCDWGGDFGAGGVSAAAVAVGGVSSGGSDYRGGGADWWVAGLHGGEWHAILELRGGGVGRGEHQWVCVPDERDDFWGGGADADVCGVADVCVAGAADAVASVFGGGGGDFWDFYAG